MMGISLQAALMLIIGLVTIKMYESFLFKKTPIYEIRLWRKHLSAALLVNCVGFFSIAMLFYSRYGYITDDLAYFNGSIRYEKAFYSLRTGTEVLYWITHQFRKYLDFDIPALHIFFGTLGYIGSLNFLKICMSRSDFRLKSNLKINKAALWILLCFPNFMAWGRFFGKDSLSFFLASLIALALCKIILQKKIAPLEMLLLLLIPFYILHLIRSHIALAIGVGTAFPVIKLMTSMKIKADIGLQGLIRFVFPVAAIVLIGFVGITETKKIMGNGKELNQESITNMLTQSTYLGAYGGSTTAIAEEIKTDSKAVVAPTQIITNIATLLFAPMPWKIRNAVDIIAIISNGILLLVLIVYYKNIVSKDLFQIFLIVLTALLILLLSFMTANVGLILRQKTIVLPFIFLILLYPSQKKDLHAHP